jgi:hypothetical protein
LKGVTKVSTKRKDAYAYVSRPGISRDGLRAFLVVDGSEGGGGVLLEKRDGVWRVIAMGPGWEY